jgi:hypothetical protein
MKDKRPDSNYNSWQLKTGTKVEMEHRVTKEKAKSIAKDHLDEFPDYYTHLTQMEKFLASKKHHPEEEKERKRKDTFGGVF